jgi:hypothetical protein
LAQPAVHIFFFDVWLDAALALEPEISLNDLPDRSHVAIFLQQPPRPFPLLSIPYLPAELPQRLKVPFVSPYRLIKLRLPESHVGGGRGAKYAVFLPMPEATMHLDCRAMPWQQDIWTTGKLRHVKAIAQP